MYTQCPECQTVFRLTEEQLALAGGKVRCGHCLCVFTARERDVDAAPKRAAPRPASGGQTKTPLSAGEGGPVKPRQSGAGPRPEAGARPPEAGSAPKKPADRVEMEREIERILSEEPVLEAGRPGPPAPGLGSQPVASRRPSAPTPKPQRRTERRTSDQPVRSGNQSRPREAPDRQSGVQPASPRRTPRSEAAAPAPADRGGTGQPATRTAPPQEAPPAPVLEKRPPSGQATGPVPAAAEMEAPEQPSMHFSADRNGEEDDGADPPLPAALRQPEKKGSGPLAVIFWSLASLLMLALLVAQYGYHERYALVKNPTYRPWLERMCLYLDCRLPPRRNITAFELQERDVRYHPEYAGALLISGTFVNKAAFAQPYPTVEVLLKDVNGEIVASRRFAPAEYLQGAAGGTLLKPYTEAHLLLEVSDPGNQAVSFEFNFL